LTVAHRNANAATSIVTANVSPARGEMRPLAMGRLRVRAITLSMSRSTYMLMALAPPAARVPPTTVQAISHTGGRPRWATIMVGTVVTSSSSMMRGLVSAT
jgi:hypothetical protein